MYSHSAPTSKTVHHTSQLVWYVTDLLELLLLFRFFLKLFGANPNAAFSDFIYRLTYIFAGPFLQVFNVSSVEGHAFEWSTLLAMFVYWLIAIGIVRLLHYK